jgi:putative membrane protein
MDIFSTILAWALVWAIGALILMVVSRLGMGLSVDGFGPATWLLGLIGISVGGPGLLGAIVTLVVAAVVLMVSASFVKGMKVNGFGGAVIAAIAYSLIAWLFQWVIGLFI